MKVQIWFRAALLLCVWQFPSQSSGQSCPVLDGPSLKPQSVVRAPERFALEADDLASLRETSHYKREGASGREGQKSGQTATTLKELPTFGESIQTYDPRGLLHIFAVASDGSVWHFREPGSSGKWIVESLGGKANGIPSASVMSNGLLQTWIVGPDHAVWTNLQKAGPNGWTGWTKVFMAQAVDVIAVSQPENRTAVVVRDMDGVLVVAAQREAGKALELEERITPPAADRPVAVVGSRGSLEIVFATKDGSLFAATREPSGKNFQTRILRAPKVKGNLSSVRLVDHTVLTMQASTGELLSMDRTDQGWSEPHVLPSLSGSLSSPKLVTLDGRSVTAFSQASNNTFWVNTISPKGEWGQWENTKFPSNSGGTPTMTINGRPIILSSQELTSLITLQLGFSLSIDSFSPNPVFEGDQITVQYTLTNWTSEVGDGQVTGYWGTEHLQQVGPSFQPLAPRGGVFKGSFTMANGQYAKPGPNVLWIDYKKSTISGQVFTGAGWVQISNLLQFAEDRQSVQVTAFTDPFPTDDPPVAAGPFACLTMTPDQLHSCGLGTCSGGNTPETCPQDCPTPTQNVRSYNSLTLCRQGTVLPNPTRIVDVLADISAAARAGRRVRVIGNRHTSNAQICTDGDVIGMSSLQGAAPALTLSQKLLVAPTAPEFCKSFDCTKSLGDPTQTPPVIETFQGVQTVRVGPGMRLFDLENFLDQNGLSIGFAVPGFRDPTVGGAIATGTHGSSPTNPSVISTRVRSLLLVTSKGELQEFSETTTPATTWKAVRTSLGFLGVVVQLRLAVEPAFNLRATVRWYGIHDILYPGAPHAPSIFASLQYGATCDWGEMVWFPHEGRDDAPVAVICETRTDRAVQDQPNSPAENQLLFPAFSNDADKAGRYSDLLQADACNGGNPSCGMEYTRHEVLRYWIPPFSNSDCGSGYCKVAKDSPSGLMTTSEAAGAAFSCGGYIGADNTSDCWVDLTGRWHRMMSSEIPPVPDRPFERDWEIFIPGQFAQAALKMAQSYFQTHRPDGVHGICLPLIGIFIRFAPPEDGTLIAHTVNEGVFGNSPTGGNVAGMFFEMPVFIPKGIKCADLARYEKVYSDLAEKLVTDFGGRGHWGKNRRSLFQLQRRLGTYGDNIKQFREVVKQMDPKGMFANQFGVDIGLRWPESAMPIPPDTETPGCTP